MSIKKLSVMRSVYLSVLINNIKSHGILWVLKKLVIKGFKELSWALLLPVAIILHVVGVRRLLVRVEHVGHLASEFDSFVKSKQLNLLPAKHKYYFVLAPKTSVSNQHLLNYWRPYVFIIKNALACKIISALTRHYFMRYDISHYISSFFGAQEIYRINRLWHPRPALLTLRQDDNQWGETQLAALGINQNQWYVCLHVREGGFLPHNEIIQSHRNAAISNTYLAINEIISRGGIVVRMGDPTMTPMAKTPGVIDYAHHPLKSERLDIILCAKAKFFLGCTSGLSFVSMIFGIPVAHANMIPVQALGTTYQDLSIPKLLWSNTKARYLTFVEIFRSDVGGYYFTHQYEEARIRVDENTSEDILNLTKEMLDRLAGNFIESEEDLRLHSEYMSLFKPWHYSYGSLSKVCIAFLKTHQTLLPTNVSVIE